MHLSCSGKGGEIIIGFHKVEVARRGQYQRANRGDSKIVGQGKSSRGRVSGANYARNCTTKTRSFAFWWPGRGWW